MLVYSFNLMLDSKDFSKNLPLRRIVNFVNSNPLHNNFNSMSVTNINQPASAFSFATSVKAL